MNQKNSRRNYEPNYVHYEKDHTNEPDIQYAYAGTVQSDNHQ